MKLTNILEISTYLADPLNDEFDYKDFIFALNTDLTKASLALFNKDREEALKNLLVTCANAWEFVRSEKATEPAKTSPKKPPNKPSEFTIKKAISEYIKEKSPNWTKSTTQNVQSRLYRSFDEDYFLSEIDSLTVRYQKNRLKKKYTAKTYKSMLDEVRRFWGWLEVEVPDVRGKSMWYEKGSHAKK